MSMSSTLRSVTAGLAILACGSALAADSSRYSPLDVPWQKPAAASADNATYAASAGSADKAATSGYAASSGTASTANALCPTCSISGGQVSGEVARAGYSDSSNYANSSNYSNSAGGANTAGRANSAGYADNAGYANNAGYASSGASTAITCSTFNLFITSGVAALPIGFVVHFTDGANNMYTYICTGDGSWELVQGW